MVKKNVQNFILITISLFFLFNDLDNNQKYINFLNNYLFFPITFSVNRLNDYIQSEKRNKQLQEEITYLYSDNLKKHNYIESIGFKIDKSSIIYADSLISFAEIVGYTSILKQSNIILDKGLSDGINLDYTVISKNNSLVGKIVSVNINSSIVLPVKNENFRVAVMSKNTGIQGVLEPSIYGVIFMSLVGEVKDIGVGDTIVTSNLSKYFRKGINIGTVKNIQYSNQKNRVLIEISPFVDFDRLERVFILRKKII